MSGVLALTSPPRLSSHSLSGLSRGSGLRARPRSPSCSWRLPGEASLCLLARLAELDTRVGVRHLSTAPGPGILDHDNVIRVNILWRIAHCQAIDQWWGVRWVLTLWSAVSSVEVLLSPTHAGCRNILTQLFYSIFKIFCERHVFSRIVLSIVQGTQTFGVVIKSFLYCWHN